MTIRAKLSAILLAAVAVTAGAVAASLLWLEHEAIQAQAVERIGVLADSSVSVARESLLSGDPMGMTDFLFFLRRSRSELKDIRLRRGEEWTRLRQPGEKPEKDPAHPVVLRREVEVRRPDRGRDAVGIELVFDGDELLREGRGLFKESLKTTALVFVLVLLLGIPASLWTGTRLAQSIERLGIGMERMAAGKDHRMIPSASKDEMGQLIAKFNTMARRLQELERLKKDFINSITHDLKTPLNVIESYVNLMQENPALDTESRDYLGTIRESTRGLSRFINQLLDAARIERGMLKLDRKRADVCALVRDTVKFFEVWAREGGVGLTADLPAHAIEAAVDPQRLTQVLHNLIGNAVKFTPEGGKVRVYAAPSSAGGSPAVEIGVRDTGPGIAPADQARIFKPFERMESAAEIEGTGLGMHIARTIVDLHGSRLRLESAPGEGSRFFFILPLTAPVKAGKA